MLAYLGDVALYVLWAKNKHTIKSFVSLFICVVNIFLTIFLVQKYGIVGAAISTFVAFVMGYIIFNSFYFHKVLKIDMIRFVKETFDKLWLALLIASLFTYAISMYLAISWITFLIQIVLTTFIYITCMWVVGMNSNEKQIVNNFIKEIIK